jgi:hypothetical protein
MTQNVIAAAAAEVAAKLDAMVLDPRELVHAALERVAALSYPCAEHEAKVAARVRMVAMRSRRLLPAKRGLSPALWSQERPYVTT